MTSPDLNSIKNELTLSAELKLKLIEDQRVIESLHIVCKQAVNVYLRGGKLLFAGNGGSAADAQHIATELVGGYLMNRPPLSAIALTTDTSLLTAVSNDFGFEAVFSRQLEAIGKRGDLIVLLSTSGNSGNILQAAKTARQMGIISVALCGVSGRLANQCNYHVSVPSVDTPRIQECHILIGHILCNYIEQTLFLGLAHE